MMTTVTDRPLLLGEWACLGILAEAPAHGYTVAQRLAPGGDIGRIWSVSRSLTYRAIDHLVERDLIRELREEQGIAGGVRTLLKPTPRGRRVLRTWLAKPVAHLRDVRADLLVKLQLSINLGIDTRPLLEAQRVSFAPIAEQLKATDAKGEFEPDPVAVWRHQYSMATMRFLDQMVSAPTTVTG
jgi:DNA-binding PadR family transcriptional regulator